MAKWVYCWRCGGHHPLYFTRGQLPYLYCDVRREEVLYIGPRPGIVIRDLKEREPL